MRHERHILTIQRRGHTHSLSSMLHTTSFKAKDKGRVSESQGPCRPAHANGYTACKTDLDRGNAENYAEQGSKIGLLSHMTTVA